MKDAVKILIYVIIFTISVAIGGWLCKYTRMYTEEPQVLRKVKEQIRSKDISYGQRLGVFCSLTPYPEYPGYYSALSEDTDLSHPVNGIPTCPSPSYSQCTNNVYSPAVNPKDNEDYFDRSLLPVGSNQKCRYASTYSSCFQKPNKTELQQIQEAYCKVKTLENHSDDGNRVNMYNMTDNVSRGDDS